MVPAPGEAMGFQNMEEITSIESGPDRPSSKSSPKEIRIIAADFGAWKARRRYLYKSNTTLLEEMIDKQDRDIRRLHEEVDNFRAKLETSKKHYANFVLQTFAELESLNPALTETKNCQTELQKVKEEKHGFEKQMSELSDELDASNAKVLDLETMQDLCEGRGALLEPLQNNIERQKSRFDKFETLLGLKNL